ncbi:response regulator [Leptolyngbya sp. CCNP1308]|uniref:response regulator n=1 Tax=Leptolyngbya sp. CCNP1308 TaxID=3110255 RepID=UPI002B206B3E|nr:response regulator [Leptolyngbya sp. CCNP1308]MEA5450587.1 response regulator [Leptolyngbya sp. CCNP1308]
MAVQTTAPVSNLVPSQVPLVLVVDDDDDSLTLMAYILEQLSCQACFVADGLAALVAAQQQRPSLILSDIYLPDVDGYSLLQQLRANGSTHDIPVVAVTALAGSDNRHKILAAGFDDYISKPFLIQSVEQLIGRFIGLSSSASHI